MLPALRLLLLALLLWAPAALATERRPLFWLGRNKNANVVEYSALLGKGDALDDVRPFEASWILRAGDGRREGLSFFEQAFAYGLSWHAELPGEVYSLSLVSCRNRTLTVVRGERGFEAQVAIGGVPSRLERIYVTANDGSPLPHVVSVELFGESLGEGTSTYEKIAP